MWEYDAGGRQQLGIGFGYGSFQAQFRYLTHGIVSRVTRGVNLGNWRNYLDIAYDESRAAGVQAGDHVQDRHGRIPLIAM